MTCKHEFIGTASGIRCVKCGVMMTTEEYRKYCNPDSEQESEPDKKSKSKKKVKANE